MRYYVCLLQETRGGKRASASYLDNEDIFLAYRTWLINQELGTISKKVMDEWDNMQK